MPIKGKGKWQKMSDWGLIHYVRSRHYGGGISQFAHSRDNTAYYLCMKRKIKTEDGRDIRILDFLVEEGTLIDKYADRKDWKNMSDWGLIHYVRSWHYGDILGEFQKYSVEAVCKKRKINTGDKGKISIKDFLTEEGTLVDRSAYKKDWKNMSDWGLIHYVRSWHYGDTISEFYGSKDNRGCEKCTKRKIKTEDRGEISIKDFLTEEGTLLREKESKVTLKRRDYIEMKILEVINKIGHFPTHDELEEQGLSSISNAITRYHDGILAVKQRMYHKTQSKIADLEAVIDKVTRAE